MSEKKYDVFVSHAASTKAKFTDEFVRVLSAFGVSVWYDAAALKPGDSLSEKIDTGIASSRFGLVVFSREFFERFWTRQELRGIRVIEQSQENSIIPVWLDVDRDFVARHSPVLADRIAIVVGENSPTVAAHKAIEVVKPDAFDRIQSSMQFLKMLDGAPANTVNLKELRKAPVRHKSLSIHMRSRLSLLQASLSDVNPLPLEAWSDNFSRDMHPHKELLWWELLAATYFKVLSVCPGGKEAVYVALFEMFMTGSPTKICDLLSSQSESVVQKVSSILKDARKMHEMIFEEYRFQAHYPDELDR